MKFMKWAHRMRPLQMILRTVIMVVLFLCVGALMANVPLLPIHVILGMVLGFVIGLLMVDNLVMAYIMFINYMTTNKIWEDKNSD